MSVSSMSSIAVSRDQAQPGQPIEVGGEPATSGKALISAIPTEILAPYTAALGFVIGVVPGDHPRDYLPLRWWLFVIALVAVPVFLWIAYRRKASGNTRWLPVAEILAPWIAAAAWFTAMPGSPFEVVLSDDTFTIMAGLTTVIAGALLSQIAPQLIKGNSLEPKKE